VTMIAEHAPPKRAVRTRTAIMDAATRLFAVRPPDSVTIDDITREADVAKGSFYTHFADKAALLTATVDDIRAEIEPLVTAANRRITDPAARVARGIAVYVRFAIHAPERVTVLAAGAGGHALASDQLNQGVVDDLCNGLAHSRFAFDDVTVAVLFIEGVVRHLMLHIGQSTDRAASISTSYQACIMLLTGLGAPAQDARDIAQTAMDEIVTASLASEEARTISNA
jgi:AcrR family transcriptional regulator